MCGLMMNDVLRIDTIASSPADSTLTKEDEAKNSIFGIVTLILNLLALLFILYTVAPEYRFVKRLIATIRMVCFLLARGAAAPLTHTLSPAHSHAVAEPHCIQNVPGLHSAQKIAYWSARNGNERFEQRERCCCPLQLLLLF
jgi:hypothetical protein